MSSNSSSASASTSTTEADVTMAEAASGTSSSSTSAAGIDITLLDSLSASRLKALLSSLDIDHSHCLEKSELVSLARASSETVDRDKYDTTLRALSSSDGTLKASGSKAKAGGAGGGGGAGSLPVISAYDIAQKIVALAPGKEFEAFREIKDWPLRRDVTTRVHAERWKSWRKHPHYAGMAKHLIEDVHPMFRDAFSQVLSQSSTGKVAVKHFNSINASLHGHHGNEDAHWFPKLKRLHPELRGEVDILEKDHATLVALEGRIQKGDFAALEEFVGKLMDHLNREELLTLPCLLEGTGGL